MRHVPGLTGKERPRVTCLPTGCGDDDLRLVAFYESFAGLGELSHVKFFPWPPLDLREHALGQDAIYVGGGNTANMLAIWQPTASRIISHPAIARAPACSSTARAPG